MSIAEKILEQARVIEESEKGGEVAPDLGAMKDAMFEASKELDRLEAELKTSTDKAAGLEPMAKIGELKIAELKSETLRMLKVICEASKDKDLSRHDRMKERFEKENLDFDALKRYFDDAVSEFDRMFPVEGRAKAVEVKDESKPDVSSFKIQSIK